MGYGAGTAIVNPENASYHEYPREIPEMPG